jgi:N-acetylmuramoyl-L-alanine amidase
MARLWIAACYHELLIRRPHAQTFRALAGGGVLIAAALLFAPQTVRSQAAYTVITASARRPLPVRNLGGAEMVSLDQIGALFGFRANEDPQVGGLTIDVRGQRVLLIAEQSFVQVSGQVRTLSAPVTRERNVWLVPIDFVTEAVAPLLGTPIEIRRPSRLVIVGDIRVPRVTGRIERQGDAARIVLDLNPAAPARVSRDGNLLTIRIDAHTLDLGNITGTAPGFVTGTRVQGTTIQVALGPSAAGVQSAQTTGSPLVIDLVPPGAAPAPAAPPPPAAGAVDLTPPGVVRTVVIDPGHGGDDAGAIGPGGTREKDITLRVARRLKQAIEGRFGFRVVLTREGDETVPIDRRSAAANHNKADLFISLHANASPGGALSGAQVLSLSVDDYASRAPRGGFGGASVPAIGGGLRTIEAVPWDLAQLPHAARSAAFKAVIVRQLTSRGVPMFDRPADELPLRVLVGANMPAVQVEMGFLSNAADEKALISQARPDAIAEALVAAIGEVRQGIPAQGRGRSER